MESKEMLYFRLFRKVCRKISESSDLNQILSLIAENAAKTLNIKGCTIYLLDKTDNKLKVGSSFGLSDTYIHKGPVDADKSMIASLKGETVFVPNVADNPRIQYPDEAVKEGITSILSVPMAVKNIVIGVLRLYRADQITYEEIEMEFISGLADMSAIAIENTRMFSHLESDYQKLINDVHMWFDFGTKGSG